MSKEGEVYAKMYVSAHAFFVNEFGETLVLQRCENNNYKPLKWDIPGGKMLSGETAEIAVAREVFEETGLRVTDVIGPLCVYVNTEQLPAREDVQIVYQCVVSDFQNVHIHPTEHKAYKWIRPEDLDQIDCMEYIFLKR